MKKCGGGQSSGKIEETIYSSFWAITELGDAWWNPKGHLDQQFLMDSLGRIPWGALAHLKRGTFED